MNLESVVIVLTATIASGGIWMAIGLLRREPGRIENLRQIGLTAPAWPVALGVGLLLAVAALLVGWWITPLGIIAIVAIKASYVAMLIGYRRADVSRERDLVTVAMTAHSVAALGLLLAW